MPARFVLRVGRGIVDHFPIRVPEWIMTYGMIGLGVVFLTDQDTFSKTPAFSFLGQMATEQTIGAICLNVGVLRLGALIINGTFKSHFPYSPHIRGFTSLLACAFWGQILLGIFVSSVTTGSGRTGIVMYSMAMMLDIWNMLRAWFDIGVAKVARD